MPFYAISLHSIQLIQLSSLYKTCWKDILRP